MRLRPRYPQCLQGGFTLLEVMIALAIAGLGLAMLFRVTAESFRAAHAAARYTEAISRAKSHLDSASAYLLAGEQDGDDGGGYRWRVRVERVDSTSRQDAVGRLIPNDDSLVAHLYAVAVWIIWRDGWREHVVKLDTRRLVTEAPQR